MIIKQHLWSNAMWAVFLLQDLTGISGSMKRQTPDEERINVPSNPNHKWRYRLPYLLNELSEDYEFTARLRELVIGSDRM
jgi:4-alpha-glucanotransferase